MHWTERSPMFIFFVNFRLFQHALVQGFTHLLFATSDDALFYTTPSGVLQLSWVQPDDGMLRGPVPGPERRSQGQSQRPGQY